MQCIDLQRPDRNCHCQGIGELGIDDTIRITNAESLATRAFWGYYSESSSLPNSLGFMDQPAYFEDLINLGAKIRKFYTDKETAMKSQLAQAKRKHGRSH